MMQANEKKEDDPCDDWSKHPIPKAGSNIS